MFRFVNVYKQLAANAADQLLVHFYLFWKNLKKIVNKS